MAKNPKAREETWYYELPLPEGLKKFSKGSLIQDEHFLEAREMWQSWIAYLDGKHEIPFEYSEDIANKWKIHYEWEVYRNALERGDKVEKPNAEPMKNAVIITAHNHEGPLPDPPYTSWIEIADDLINRGYDLIAKNPNQDDRLIIPPPAEITAQLLERVRELNSTIEFLHQSLGNGDE